MSDVSLKLKYLQMLPLRNYKEDYDKVNFSCPICGDSESRPQLARGFMLNMNQVTTHYKCFNCNIKNDEDKDLSFQQFLEKVDYGLFQKYKDEKRKNKIKNFKEKDINIQTQIVVKDNKIALKYFDHSDVCLISNLNKEHPASIYLLSRNIPNIHFNNLFYFKGNPYSLFKDIFEENKYPDKADKNIEHEGILIPRTDDEGNIFGFSLRRINIPKYDKFRYLRLNLDRNVNFFFNQQKVNWRRPVYITEGELDVLSLSMNEQLLGMLNLSPKLELIPDNADITYIIDNDYEKPDAVKTMKKIQESGHKLFIWPNNIQAGDLNDLRKLNYNDEQIMNIINNNSFSGLKCKLLLDKKLKHKIELFKIGGNG
jgi:predicted RNA-binding Zn-ribbon protein involved in translation (DUF1610 family)